MQASPLMRAGQERSLRPSLRFDSASGTTNAAVFLDIALLYASEVGADQKLDVSEQRPSIDEQIDALAELHLPLVLIYAIGVASVPDEASKARAAALARRLATRGVRVVAIVPRPSQATRGASLASVASSLGMAPDECWLIGDQLDDVEIGNRAGCRSLMIDNGSERDWRGGSFREPLAKLGNLAAAIRVISAAATSPRYGWLS